MKTRTFAAAQGTARDGGGNLLEGAAIFVAKNDNSALLAAAYTDAQGRYRTQPVETSASLTLCTTARGFAV